MTLLLQTEVGLKRKFVNIHVFVTHKTQTALQIKFKPIFRFHEIETGLYSILIGYSARLGTPYMVGGGMGGGMVMMPNGQMAMAAGQMGGGQIMMTPQGQMIQGMFFMIFSFLILLRNNLIKQKSSIWPNSSPICSTSNRNTRSARSWCHSITARLICSKCCGFKSTTTTTG